MDDLRPIIRGLKFSDFKVALEHSISISSANSDAVLVPVGQWILKDAELISHMTDWRQAAKNQYFAKFPPSVDSFTKYLKTHSVLSADTILFTIYSRKDGFKGHIGLSHVTAEAAEIDAVMLSPSAQGQGLAKAALGALIAWTKATLDIDNLTLEVLSTNAPAIGLYSRFRFEITTITPLREADGTLTILVDCEPGKKTTELSRVVMIRRADKS